MTISTHHTPVKPPQGFERIDPTDPDSSWIADGLGFDFTLHWTPEHGVELYGGWQRVPSSDIISAAQDLLEFFVRVRNAQAEDARNRGDR